MGTPVDESEGCNEPERRSSMLRSSSAARAAVDLFVLPANLGYSLCLRRWAPAVSSVGWYAKELVPCVLEGGGDGPGKEV